MAPQKICQQCSQKHSCQQVYQQLGNMKGPSVVWKVIAAFLLPMVVFIAALVTFEEILASKMNVKELQATFSFLLALSVTFVFILTVKNINKRISKHKHLIGN